MTYSRGPFHFIDWGSETGAHIPTDYELLMMIKGESDVTLGQWNKGSSEDEIFREFVAWIKENSNGSQLVSKIQS